MLTGPACTGAGGGGQTEHDRKCFSGGAWRWVPSWAVPRYQPSAPRDLCSTGAPRSSEVLGPGWRACRSHVTSHLKAAERAEPLASPPSDCTRTCLPALGCLRAAPSRGAWTHLELLPREGALPVLFTKPFPSPRATPPSTCPHILATAAAHTFWASFECCHRV